jgi:hypothetical protein
MVAEKISATVRRNICGGGSKKESVHRFRGYYW